MTTSTPVSDEQAHRLASCSEASSMAIFTTNARGRITSWNAAAERTFRRSCETTLNRSIELLIPDRVRREFMANMKAIAAGSTQSENGRTIEVVGLNGDGAEFPMEIAIWAWEGPSGKEYGAQVQDVSGRRARETKLRHLAHHDVLTGLPNRIGIRDQVTRCLRDSGRASVLVLDINGFKAINDTLGHEVGDALLQMIALRLRSNVGEGAQIARIDGDSFAVLLPNKADLFAVRAMTGNLLGAFKVSFLIGGHDVHVSIGLGAAIAPLHAFDTEELMVRADLAMLQAKKDGGNAFRLFDIGMANQLAASHAFKDELRRATIQQEWELFYQPQVRLSDGVLIGMEALLRWRHPERGLIAPAAFMQILETHLVAYDVGRWVLDDACRQLALWRRQGCRVPCVGVNLFAAQIRAGTIESDVRSALHRHGLKPADLELELTETIALRADEHTLAPLRALRASGVGVAFDDFGTGFASLTTLKHFPVTRLKIDKSFVQDLGEVPHSAAIVGAVVSIGQSLGLDVIAEGVETEAQRRKLAQLGCRHGQGYLFGKPVPATDIPSSVRTAA